MDRSGSPYPDITEYQQAVGSILYAALGSRPDIAYAAGVLGRYNSAPTDQHWAAVKHLLRYLQGTKDLQLTIYMDNDPPGSPDSDIIAYSDADLGGDVDSGKSTSGIVIHAFGILVMWKSQKQRLVATGTMEAELVACMMAKHTIDWLRDIISELETPETPETSRSRPDAPILYCDNQSAVTVVNSGNFSANSRHIRLRAHALIDAVRNEELQVRHIGTTEMLADGLTKPLKGAPFTQFVKDIGLH
jgi:hypothetical protein